MKALSRSSSHANLRRVSLPNQLFSTQRLLSIFVASVALVAESIAATRPASPQFEALPLQRAQQNHLLVRAFINNRPASLIVDTGSPHTVIAPGRRDYFHLALVNDGLNAPARVQANGVFTRLALAHSLRLGGLNIVDVPAILVDLAESRHGAASDRRGEPDGILGADVLSATKAILDCQQQVLILNMFPDTPGRAPDSDFRDFQRVPMEQIGGRLYVDVTVNGTVARLLVDTGAFATLLHRSFVQQLQIPVQQTRIRAAAINVKEKRVQVAQIRKLSLGPLNLVGPLVGVVDLEHIIHRELLEGQPPVAGLLGAEFLSRLHAVVDFGSRTLYLKNERARRDGSRIRPRP